MINHVTTGEPIDILLVEDDPGDVRLTMEALCESDMCNNLCVVWDGEEALNFLRREGKHVGAIRPDLILLDLNLPKKDGRRVLSEIKDDPSLKHIPVVILTTSRADEDILRSYNLHANCYVTKPVGLDQFISVIRAVHGFWFNTAKLPPKTQHSMCA